ncbi:signal transduction histidine kinase [Catenuloplanes nepalensis]|uniref:Signal transduction histidine kinase n=2 Tax=Catenuloplanes nepalensis TaxID=587533 RepID=A0ABT9N1P7_9ACTN|nr:signal transduction histidine kinase [Catenuloplanes nepalensis]
MQQGLAAPMWRAIGAYRIASLLYVMVLIVRNVDQYANPLAAGPALALMVGWTAFATAAFARPAWRRWPLLIADLAVALAVVVASPYVVGQGPLNAGVPTLAVAWLGAPVLAWAVSGGRRRGLTAALLLGTADIVVRDRLHPSTLNGFALMVLAGFVVGLVARLAADAEERMQRAIELEAATRERERLARDIHDSVLQVLALVQRRGAQLPGEAGELARLAGQQEAKLRMLIADGPSGPPPGEEGEADLRAVLGRFASDTVSIASPATPVPLPVRAAEAVGAAVRATLDNVDRHAGPAARAWVLLEDDDAAITVSIRDDGPGFPDGRLEEAASQGRLGVAQSVRGRIADLGGTAEIYSKPGEGTEVELHIPRH